MKLVIQRYFQAAMALIVTLVLVAGGFFLLCWLAWIWWVVPHYLTYGATYKWYVIPTPAIFALIIGMTILVITTTMFIWKRLWAKQLKKQVSMKAGFHRHFVKP